MIMGGDFEVSEQVMVIRSLRKRDCQVADDRIAVHVAGKKIHSDVDHAAFEKPASSISSWG